MPIEFRPYQIPIFQDNTTGVLLLHWARQIGKSYVLAAWAIWRLLTKPGRLVTVLSNSKDNGIEFAQKCQAICAEHGAIFEQFTSVELETLVTEIRIKVQGRTGRIKILASNPRTARGFSGDLILDEFAFHQDAQLIWEAAEPILSSNKDFLCRIASTGNGRNNLFYQFATGGQFPVSRMSRTDAWRQGTKVYHPVTRAEVTPAEARAASIDKIAYDQNYELAFTGAGAQLLTADAVLRAETPDCGAIYDGPLPTDALARLGQSLGSLFVGIDVGRNRDLTVVDVLEYLDKRYHLRAKVRLAGISLREQAAIIKPICGLTKVMNGAVDMTGIGLGLAEEIQSAYPGKITGIHFAQTTPWLDCNEEIMTRITDAMAIHLLQLFESDRIAIPAEAALRSALQLPERSGSLRGAIYTPRSNSGHADDFWSLALAAWCARPYEVPFQWTPLLLKARARTVSL
jgi:phage FluMu gp28-like protein